MAEVMEGFLCPLCMKDLGDLIQLQIHFEEKHSKEDQAFVQSLKDLFGKAKKKILSEEEENLQSISVSKLKVVVRDDDLHPVSGIRTDIHPAFHPASPSSHFSQFKKTRSERVDRYAAETNRLIVRLDRLLGSIPSDASKRREHEQSVVRWVEEDLVKLCPNCAKSFNIARRKHHCRLCGSVMCKDCSKFVEWNFCRKLINPSTLSIYSMKPRERQGWSVNGKSDTRSMGSISKPLFKLKRSNSKESLHSMLALGEGKSAEEFRTCEYCLKLLKHRDAAIELQTVKPIITQFYEKLREYVEAGITLSEKYLEMSESLSGGETNYQLSDAKNLRLKLLKLAENVDMMSKKISVLGTDNENDSYVNTRKYLLQTQIRRASVNFIKETLVGLPSLPTEEELIILQEQRKVEVARKVEEERRKAQEARQRFKNLQEKKPDLPKGKMPRSESDQSIKYERGFALTSSERDEFAGRTSEDPMVQQMNIIRSYISKAREAHRFDEVRLLESNLKELQTEYQRMQREMTEAVPHTGYESFNLDSSESSENLSECSSKSSLAPAPKSKLGQGQIQVAGRRLSSGILNSSRELGAKPVLEEVARTVSSVRDYLPNKSLLTGLNPFGTTESEDEYDASGKNPFSE